MKISKLFHWLYALVMFLPILMFIPSVLYCAFNEHAELSTETPSVEIENEIEYTYKYKTNVVNSVNDLIQGNSYLITYNGNATQNQYYFNVKYAFKKWKSSLTNNYWYGNEFSIGDTYELYSTATTNSNVTRFYGLNSNNIMSWTNNNFNDLQYGGYLLITYDYSNNTDFYQYFNFSPVPDYLNEIESATANSSYTIDYQESSITDVVYQGWQQVWDLPIFSWTSNTYFTQPFTFISGLFGWQSNNTISYCLSYWFSISIIWLVFDVMIYVPMLVHRWLDKASIS